MSAAKSRWQKVKLRDVLRRTTTSMTPVPDMEYREVTVRMSGRGVVERGRTLGANLSGRRFIARCGNFIASRIDARNGAMGLVPPELDGAVVTNDFPLFDLDTSRLHPEYMRWLCRAPAFVDLCTRASEGTTNRIRLSEDALLDFELRLPPIAEQLTAVSGIQEVFSQFQLATAMREAADADTATIVKAALQQSFVRIIGEHACAPFGDLLSRSRSLAPIEESANYSGLGTRMWGGGVYVHEVRSGKSFDAERYVVHPGQLIYNEVWAHNGAIGIVPGLGQNLVVSRHFHVFNLHRMDVMPEFLTWYFRSPNYWSACQAGSVSTTGRGHMRREHLLAIGVPTPPLTEQQAWIRHFDDLRQTVSQLSREQCQSRTELNALLPAILDRAFAGAL